MPKFRTKVVTVQADLWRTNGDHPEDGTERFTDGPLRGELFEGKVVRYYRNPFKPGDTPCNDCGKLMQVHGWIDTGDDGIPVCPGDYVLTPEKGERSVMHAEEFLRIFEPVC